MVIGNQLNPILQDVKIVFGSFKAALAKNTLIVFLNLNNLNITTRTLKSIF